VFGGSEANLRLGLETLLGVLNTSSRQGLNAELTRYTLSLMVLERKLKCRQGAMDTLGNRIGGLRVSWNTSICNLKPCSAPWRASMLTSSARWGRVFR
jgi:high frequency lysogenization protein